MPALGFRNWLAHYVDEGSKTHTIRNRRKIPIVKGDQLYFYMGMRTKRCISLGSGTCTGVRSIYIGHNKVYLYPRVLTDDELKLAEKQPYNNKLEPFVKLYDPRLYDLLAWNDGFRPEGTSIDNLYGCWLMMRKYFQEQCDPFVGDIIYWKKNRPEDIPLEPIKKKKTRREKIDTYHKNKRYFKTPKL